MFYITVFILHKTIGVFFMRAYERFLDYISYDTQSDDKSESFPSTAKQLKLAEHLAEELRDLGIADASMDSNGYVYGTIPASKGSEDKPGFALIAHMDTALDMSGSNIKPRIVEYNGGDIILNEELGIVTRLSDFPDLKESIGEHLIVTDGTTLLGADDKAGIAEIMTMTELLMSDPSLKHPKIVVVFTPDEEIGRGVDRIDMSRITVPVGYTSDGGKVGELQWETFNASSATVTIHGITSHPGSAKGKMRNAMLLAMEYNSLLPQHEIPFCTEKKEGFYHLAEMSGTVETAVLSYMLRDHDAAILRKREEMMEKAAAFLREKYGKDAVEVEIKQMYRNMGEEVSKHPELIDAAISAMEEMGIRTCIPPVRGGTDGSRLSFMGLPCPNICTGGHNGHSRHEYVSVESLDKCTEILVHLAAKLA